MWGGFALGVVAGLAAAGWAQPSVTDQVSCPSHAEVEAELIRLGAERGTYPEIAFEGSRMRVVLRGRDGAMLGSREVEAPAACHERATVAAVLVGTWMGIWPVGSEPTRPPAGQVGTPAPRPQSIVSATPRARRTEIGLAATGDYDGNASAWGVAVEVRRRLAGPWRAGVGVISTSERDLAVGPGLGGYTRPSFELSSALRLLHGRVQVEIGASARLGIAILRGKELPVTHRKLHPAAGMASDLRLVLQSEQFSPFIVATGSYWFGRQELTLDDDRAVATVPRWDVGLGLGLLWSL
jgi:hypothetical protein